MSIPPNPGITAYDSLAISKLQSALVTRNLSDKQIEMVGKAAEAGYAGNGAKAEKILQRIINSSEDKSRTTFTSKGMVLKAEAAEAKGNFTKGYALREMAVYSIPT